MTEKVKMLDKLLGEHFWKKVDRRQPDECWEWKGAKISKGYGHVWCLGKPRRAHRVAWELTYGSIPNGMCVLHRCDNPGCVNPRHLWLGTCADNSQDMIVKGRQATGVSCNTVKSFGEKNGQAKLIETEVLAIRKDERSLRVLGKLYGVSYAQIGQIKRRTSWGWL